MMHMACCAAVFGCLLLSMSRVAIPRCDVQDLPENGTNVRRTYFTYIMLLIILLLLKSQG